MPSTKSIGSGAAPVRGSVGRLRVDAPVEAFGGGRGLQQLGAGVSNLGGGVRAAGEAQDRRREVADLKKRKIAAQQASFNINQALSRQVSEMKRRKGTEAFGS